MEGYTSVNGSAGNSAPVGLGGRRRSHKKLRLVKKRTVKRMLKKMGLKLRGGGAAGELEGKDVVTDAKVTGLATAAAPAGGRRRSRKGRKSARRSRKVFGLF
jgi:hypothetical protein